MKTQHLMKVVSVFVCALFMASNTVLADSPVADNSKLMDKIAALESKIAQLESKVAMQGHITPTKETPMVAPTGSGLLKSNEDIHFGGYISTDYNLNTSSPQPTAATIAGRTAGTPTIDGNNTNTRAFDRDSNSFGANGKMTFEKAASEAGTAGFRTDLMFGRTAQILNSATTNDSTDNFFVEQAYVQYIAPIGNGVDIKAGRFVTIAGAEVIESKDNWNSSRGLLFNNAIPFTHNGVLASYTINDLVDVKAGVANGWDSSVDNNKSKTLLSAIALHPMAGLDITNNFIFGSEQARTVGGLNIDDNSRGLWDLVVAWQPISDNDRWKVLANFDYGWEEKASAIGSSGNASWHGFALGTKYDVNDKLTLAARWEYFADPDGARLGSVNGITAATSTTLYEMTYTADYKLANNLLTRLEYRYDQASDNLYDLSNGLSAGLSGSATNVAANQSQHTIGAEMIYVF